MQTAKAIKAIIFDLDHYLSAADEVGEKEN
jgi:hypothetical protein